MNNQEYQEALINIKKRRGMWSFEEAQGQHHFDEHLAKTIIQMFPEQTAVADVGCGPGHYCAFFTKEAGWDVFGYEGTPNKFGIFNRIIETDLSMRQEKMPKHSLVVSLEVGEHIPKEFEDNFLDNITSMAAKDLVLSWAVKNQGGFGHFNEQDNDYVITQVEKRGFKYNKDKSGTLRDGARIPWFKSTLLVFEKKENTNESNKTIKGDRGT